MDHELLLTDHRSLFTDHFCALSPRLSTLNTQLGAHFKPQPSHIKSAGGQPARLCAGIDLLAPVHFGLSA
jgi:hypothetical protein